MLRCSDLLVITDIADHMIRYLDAATSKDMIWQRISCALINHLSLLAVDTFVERILLTTKPLVIYSTCISLIDLYFINCLTQISHELQ